MSDENSIENLEKRIKILENELNEEKLNYKKQAMEIGKFVFQNEDYEYEIKKLKEENKKLKKENAELNAFKQEVESSTSWKLKSILK
ncbi:hypothetical protein OTK55_07970 [Methanosphaera sp. Vir-13MRS]|jgi:chromosome segregation ATPase|uniref:hypothetical protein n=1 Tax=Candidatus Methanosphaera massiliense TaxID=3017187 RepID=UPI002380C3F8|nr:hypothetical protein [Candidatus Methanosphaera massiliense]MDD6286404.1 hypothetical protein [Methanobacteriaceae archaeon]MDE4078954.1 hypothetical protein [Candidatus Methanosphaera massiliense]MDY2744638.1 hypothetical protein [Methanosphaera sp.]